MTDPSGGGPTSVADHRDRVRAGVAQLTRSDLLPPGEALGRVLATDVVAALSVPPFDHAAMDGFAVRAAEVGAPPVELPVAGVVAAGDTAPPSLPAGTAYRIMTGAPVPPGADLVIPFEWTTGSDPVRLLRTAAAGRHVRREGEDVRAGEVALAAGTRVDAAQIGLLTSVGVVEVAVRPRPRLAVIATGAELVGGQIPDSNTQMLLAAGRTAGAVAASHGPAPDDPDAFRAILAEAAEVSDLVVTTGGISAGDHDVVKAALGAEDDFWFGPVELKPGRPQGFGRVRASDGRRVPVLALPGTPIAAYAAFLLFGREALARLGGRPAAGTRRARLGVPVTAGDRTVVLPGRYDENGHVVPLPGHAGHSQRLLAQAEVLMVVPPARCELEAGRTIEVLV
ncbi:molybdopterin molybdotransferase MoeA [Nocardioides carbamazepini]|uniref:molybdopterin molybdotransferase MoeA n=1 Tax=Nocardioides carbamazepini TaxID=2854259 RepID=UPI002149FFC0|nr:gephyrin-like molybdotransferase Glp [Nocardioides carbamazepini]MCR1783981.1 molybdopterin molybdotransferase MoeA [Nocardioides carbamazepini]